MEKVLAYFSADTKLMSVSIQTLVANTNLALDIPKNCVGVQIGGITLSGMIFFRINGQPMTIPTNTFIQGGYFSDRTTSRMLSEEGCPTGWKLNLISSVGGTIAVEFWA